MGRGHMRRQVLARLYRAILVAACLLAPVSHTVRAAETPSIAVFDFELVDTSIQGDASPEELARLKLITDEMRARLEDSGRYRVVDIAPLVDEIADAGYLRTCNGCDVRLAHEVGAELALVGWVQKVSNLILNINVQIRDVATRELRFAGSVDIRGNTDESWLHGVRYLAKNRLLKGPDRG